MYIVRYYGGSYDDFYRTNVFVTTKKSTATKYVSRFNKILKKWKKYYVQFEIDEFGMKWIADEHVEKHFMRWHRLQDITKCYWEEINER